jgi:hypothetical protein
MDLDSLAISKKPKMGEDDGHLSQDLSRDSPISNNHTIRSAFMMNAELSKSMYPVTKSVTQTSEIQGFDRFKVKKKLVDFKFGDKAKFENPNFVDVSKAYKLFQYRNPK